MNRIIVPLDVPSAAQALTLADTLRGQVGAFKVGKELFTAAGPDVVRALVAKGDRVFLDLKYHDIPNTVAGAVRSASELGVWMLNIHASGGRAMMEAARNAVRDIAPKPLLIGVTVLTSLGDASLREAGVDEGAAAHADRLAKLTKDSGLDGVVCSPWEATAIKSAHGARFLAVTPGIRLEQGDAHDQVRIATPDAARRAGADYLVIGRPITQAADPHATLRQINTLLGTLE